VTCFETSCTVTLSGNATAQVLDTTFSLEDISDGRATLLVDGEEVTCTEGQTVPIDSLTLQCTSVTGDAVTFDVHPD
jgi:hypothetical protein